MDTGDLFVFRNRNFENSDKERRIERQANYSALCGSLQSYGKERLLVDSIPIYLHISMLITLTLIHSSEIISGGYLSELIHYVQLYLTIRSCGVRPGS